jgi:uncharacterized protein (DUF1501 family)
MPASHVPTRRALIAGSGVLFAWAGLPRAARATGHDPRFVAIVLRGALDGLATVAPIGDPHWRELRGADALRLDGAAPGLPLDGMFALNPGMPELHRLYRSAQATIVHAAATPYRDRSHFDGQDVLQTGAVKPGALDTGWLNRALAALPAERAANPHSRGALTIGPVVPLVMRGPAPVMSWEVQRLPPVSDETTMRLLDLYRHTDAAFAHVLEERVGIAAIARAGGIDMGPPQPDGRPAVQPNGIDRVRAYFADTAAAAAAFLKRDDGPRVGALVFDGWDTHVNEGPVKGRLTNLLGALDGALGTLAANIGEAAWRETVVVVITEFGRTAQINGGGGTDHGTATVALLAGGALAHGGRVVADWPGLKDSDLLQNRDLRPTIDLRAVLKGLLRDHLGVTERFLASAVFPDSAAVKPMAGLIA